MSGSMPIRLYLAALLIAAAFLAAGCGDRNAEAEADSTTAAVTESGAAALADTNTEFTPDNRSRVEVNDLGHFEAYWPSGCAKLRTRVVPSKIDPTRNMAVDITCERGESEEYGCRVNVHFEMTDGGVATVGHVTGGMARTIASLGLEIVNQHESRSNGMEGIVAFCRESEGRRVVWMEGYLNKGRVLQTMAWGPDERIYEDEEIKRFMRSVKFLE